MSGAGADLSGTRMVIWRHGNTDWNSSGRFQGQTDIPLNDLGLAQAALAAAKLAELRPDALVTSDLRRAAQTAAALAEISGLPAHRDPRLRERHFGAWQGLSRAEIIARNPAGFEAWLHGDPLTVDGIEPVEELVKRSTEAASAAAERAPGGTVVVVTHGGTGKWILGALLGWPDDLLAGLTVLGNCHWAELVHHGSRGWRLDAYNRTAG